MVFRAILAVLTWSLTEGLQFWFGLPFRFLAPLWPPARGTKGRSALSDLGQLLGHMNVPHQ
jgi:hypothetical protein